MDYVARGRHAASCSTTPTTASRQAAAGARALPVQHLRRTASPTRPRRSTPAPKHPVLDRAEPIGPDDFAGWVQERGLYFAEHVGPAVRDAARDARPRRAAAEGRAARRASYGKGAFVYTGLAFFRQLPAGVPGAYRLFANLVAGSSG